MAAETAGPKNRREGATVPVKAGRKVLDSVPGFRYIKDGFDPFALCLKSCLTHLGEPRPYGGLVADSGACFRMAWNHTKWDEGNMGLGHLGPEPFRRGMQCAGYRPRFLVRPEWWQRQTASDIERVPRSADGKRSMRDAIVASIDRGLPVLAFGVVGPPEVSLITGYDEGGEVMVGWSCHAEAHPPKDETEPNGMFRQRDWWEATPGLILLDGKLGEAEVRRVRGEALEWAYRVMTMPKNETHEFGESAYKSWCYGLIRDNEFPEGDETTLQSRRFTFWDGIIMQADRDDAAALLEREADSRLDAAGHLTEAARCLRAEHKMCGRAQAAIGGEMLPSAGLADPVKRRAAIDVIQACRNHYVQATKHLALALGKKPPGVVAGAVPLEGLRPAYRSMTLMGCMLGAIRYLGVDVDPAWLYGISGVAFLMNIDQGVDVSGPTSWGVDPDGRGEPDGKHLVRMLPYLGVTIEHGLAAWVENADFVQKHKEAQVFVREKVDAGIPCVSWDGDWPEYTTVNGYTPDAVVEWTHFVDGGYRVMRWETFGRNITQCFRVFSVEPVESLGDEREAVLKALHFALSLGSTDKPVDLANARGMQAYDLWLHCLETGEWREAQGPGMRYNAACWGECRAYAEAFLRLAGRRLGDELQPLFGEAADHYKVVCTSLTQVQNVLPRDMQREALSAEDQARAAQLLRTARDAEKHGLAAIERIVNVLKAEDRTVNQENADMIRIETKRLILRPFTADDWRDFGELSVYWAAAPGPAFDKWPTSEEASKGSVAYMSTSDKYLAMSLRESGKVVGLLAMNGAEEGGEFDVGHVILSTYQDNDHDREALQALIQHCFDTQGIPAVITHNADHAPQLAPLKSLGFTTKDPKDRGTLVITRQEWDERQRQP
ncbi:MAG: GNAT family N-acetyltransferase [Lentisphaerae bacterium]|nr:GNAT family N-acetyltransferase [Lentisphaerota bacterium]